MKSRWTRLPGPHGPSPVYESATGARVHLGGLIRMADERIFRPFNYWPDTQRPEWRRARTLEPTPRRALMMFAEMMETP